MRVRAPIDGFSLLLLLGALIGLFILGPLGSVFAELDEPPGLTQPEGNQGSVLEGDGSMVAGPRMAGFDSVEETEEAVLMDNLRRGVLAAVSWIFLVVGLTLVAITSRKTYVWLKAVHKARVPPTRYFNLLLQVRNRYGEMGLFNFDYYPVVVAACGSADLLLPEIEDKRTRFRIDYHQGQAQLFSNSSIIVNGVPRQSKPLKQDDRIIFGPYRLIFKDASIQEQSPPVPGKPVFAWQFPIVALLLALSVLFKQAGEVPEDTVLLAKAAELHRIEQQRSEPEGRESPALEPAEEGSVTQPAGPQPAALSWTARLQEARPQEIQEQRFEQRKPEEQKPAAGVAAVARSPAGHEVRTEASIPRTADTVASSVAVRKENRPTPHTVEDSKSSGQKVTVSQTLPAREVLRSSELPVETDAEVPKPQPTKVSTAAVVTTPPRRRETSRVPALQASVLGTVAPPVVQQNGINPLEALGFAKARSAPEIGRVKVRVIPPGRSPEYFKADILFIHAHPDDESIDFGSLMAMASRSNKRIVTLIFTDGESGLDLYPERKVGDIYPARDLSGGALSQVRVVEATRALSILGSEMYVRWGLENRPYNSKTDEVPPDEVIRGWGGENRLVERLIEVIEGFRPTIVVSPDRHSKAYEHFEHEAVGQLVQAALERLRRDGKASFVKGYIVSIDPYQVDRYSGVTRVDAQATDGRTGLSYRAIQTLALKEHVTQRDAAVIGVSRLSHLPVEFYKALYWDLDLSLEEYLK